VFRWTQFACHSPSPYGRLYLVSGISTENMLANRNKQQEVSTSGYGLDVVPFLAGTRDLHITASGPAMRPTQLRIQRVKRAPSLEVKRQGHISYHLPLYSDEVKNEWSNAFPPPYAIIPCIGTTLTLPIPLRWDAPYVKNLILVSLEILFSVDRWSYFTLHTKIVWSQSSQLALMSIKQTHKIIKRTDKITWR
jgi:hypothetical protein